MTATPIATKTRERMRLPPSGGAFEMDGADRGEVLHLLPNVRTERLIAIGRLLLSVCTLFAVTVGTRDYATDVELASLILLAYSTYGVAVLVALRIAHAMVLRHRLTIHLVDMAVFGALLLITGRSASGFFAALMIPIVAGTLRWHDTGALRTGTTVLLFFAGLQIYDFSQNALDVNAALVRSAVFIGVVLLLAEVGRLERRHRAQVAHVARAPRAGRNDVESVIRELLPHAAAAVDAPRAFLAVDHAEEPWLQLYSWADGQHSRSHVTHVSDEPLVNPALAGAPFLWKRGNAAVVYLAGDSLRVHRGQAIAVWFAPHLEAQAALVLPVRGDGTRGQLFLLDAQDLTADDLRLGRVLARQVSNALEHFELSEQVRDMSAAQERVRISRELHDGVLQTLTGIALKLATVGKLVKTAPVEASRQLEELEQLIVEEQRDLRFYTMELRLRAEETGGVLFPQALSGLLTRVQKVWGITTSWNEDEAESVPAALGWDAYQLVHEATVNAARHGLAKRVDIRISKTEQQVLLVISDDGIGFPFHGRMQMEELLDQKRGPRSLRERVESLGGRLSIDSRSSGATLEIELPTEQRLSWRSES